MKKFATILFVFILRVPVYAQIQLSGNVLDAANREGLPYVNIGIKHTGIGTASSSSGVFSITIPAENMRDSLTLSMVGYEPLTVAVKQAGDTHTFFLKQLTVHLNEIVITNKKLPEKKYGIVKSALLHFTDGSTNQTDIFEIAQLIKLGNSPIKITSVNLHINEVRNDSGTFRINFYHYDGNRPAGRAIEKRIVQTHAIQPGWLHFDLSKQAIYLKGDIVAAIEFIPSPNITQRIVYEIKPGGRIKSFVRRNSQGEWQVPPHQYRMYVTALAVTDHSMEEREDEKERTPSFRMYSRFVNDSYSVFVRLPKHYNNLHSYPTRYILDANLYFNYLADSLDKTNQPQPILIGIGYRDFAEMDALRNRDYTYPGALPDDSLYISGGGERFYNFIRKELVPRIDSIYSADPEERTLMGHSLGGYFTLFALFKDIAGSDKLFSNYIAASPSLDYHNQYLLDKFTDIHSITSARKKVYITWGGQEDEAGNAYSTLMETFTKQLQHPPFSFLSVTQQVYPYAGHMETAVPTFYYSLSGQ